MEVLMKPLVAFVVGVLLAAPAAADTRRPVSTYSIVAWDEDAGQMGVAVQSHWFSVGSIVSWAESGVGVVATQSFVEPSYGALGLELMHRGKSAAEALRGLLAADAHPAVRQVAMADARGGVATHTGTSCIAAAGHAQGDHVSCQANMMERDTVWAAMKTAYEKTRGELAERLLAALEAAEGEKGDIRGRQSAALLVVSIRPSGAPWRDRVYDLRVEDHPAPLVELRRLTDLARAYNQMNRGDDLMTENRVAEALQAYSAAMAMQPENAEMVYWPAVTLASLGRVAESLPLFRRVFAMNRNWAELTRRLVPAGQLPADPELLRRILEQLPPAAAGKKK